METTVSFGYWVRRRRKALDLTQEELARLVACSLATIKKIELDERRPSRQMAERLAECLAVPQAERGAFLQAARAERSPDHLLISTEPVPREDAASVAALAGRTNLPTPVTRLVGRAQALEQVNHLLGDPQARLLTLTGPGGVGKTRLALQAASELAGEFPDGVWLAELAPLTDPTLVAQEVALTLGVFETAQKPLVDTLVAALQNKKMLLVLDNCEHLIAACARLSQTLITRCPQLSILATSREPLHIPGEVAWPVPPLELPDLHALPAPEALSRVASVRLFLERAQDNLPAFTLIEQNASAVAQICSRLDGLPLAIELAAARVKVLAPEQIAARLDDAFQLLTGGSRTALPKHQTLQATLDWSYNLLSEPEQALFRRLAVFAGGFTLEAALAVGSRRMKDEGGRMIVDGGRASPELAEGMKAEDGGVRGEEVLDRLASLVDKSLVGVMQEGGGPRYHLLETVRQYAGEKLTASGELADRRERHASYYLQLVEEIEPKLMTSESLARLDQLEAELDNLRAALDWLLREAGSPRAEAGLRMATQLGRFWGDRCYFGEGLGWIERGLALVENENPRLASLLARACHIAGMLVTEQYGDGNEKASRLHERSIALSRASGDQITLSGALRDLAKNTYFSGDRETAHALIEESLEICRSTSDKHGLAMSLSIKGGLLSWLETDYDQARACTEESIRLFMETGDRLEADANYSQLGMIALYTGDYEQAIAYTERALKIYRENRDKAAQSWACFILGRAAHLQGDYRGMVAYFQQSLNLERELYRFEGGDGFFLWMIGLGLLELGELRQAVERFKECLSLVREFGVDPVTMSNLLGWARVALAIGEKETAARLVGAFEALRLSTPPLNHHEVNANARLELDRATVVVHAHIHDAAFAKAYEEGQTLTVEQAVQEMLEFAGQFEASAP